MDGCRKGLRYLGRKIAEFFGVNEEENIVWRGAFENKAQTGRVGLPLGYVLSNENVVYAKDKMLHELQESISQIVLDKEDVTVSNHVLKNPSYCILSSEHLLKVPSIVRKTPNTSAQDINQARLVCCPRSSPQVHITGAGPSGVPGQKENNYFDLKTEIPSSSCQDGNFDAANDSDSGSLQDSSFKSATSTLPEALERLHRSSSSIQSDVFFDAEKDFNNSGKETESDMALKDERITLNHSTVKVQEGSSIEIIKNKTTNSTKIGSSLFKNSKHGRTNSVSPMNILEVAPNCHENRNNSMKPDDDDKEPNSTTTPPRTPKSKKNPGTIKNSPKKVKKSKNNQEQSNLNEKDEVQDLREHEINSNIPKKKKKKENRTGIQKTTTENSGKNADKPKLKKFQDRNQRSSPGKPITSKKGSGKEKRETNISEIENPILNRRFFSASHLESDKKEKHVGFSQPVSSFALEQNNTLSPSQNRGLRNHSSKGLSLLENDVLIEEEDVRLTGHEALEFYKQFTSFEKELKIKEVNETKDWVIENYKWRIDMVKLLSATAKEYYTNPQGEARRMWKNLRQEINQKSSHSLTDARIKEAELKQFKPYFTYTLILIHIMTFCIMTSIGGFNRIALEHNIHLEHNVQTFLGTETVHDWKFPNIWIGTDMMSMIRMGAVHAPCIRRDYRLQLTYLQSYDTTKSLGCCEILMRNTAGTTTKNECDKYTNGVGLWRTGVECSRRTSGHNHVAHILRPCCVGLKAECQLVSHEHCLFLGGTFFREKDHCTQVNCLSNLCGTTPTMTSESTSAGYPVSPNQVWRVVASMFYCHGVVHLLLLMCVEWVMMRMVERSAGWLRTMIVFVLSGIASVIAASIISPYTPQIGSTGGVFGAVGVAIVEVIQAWKILSKPRKELAKIIIFTAFFFISGLLPLVSNFAMMVGIVIGILSAMLFLPYITLGVYKHHGRIVMIIISLPLLFMMFFVLILTYVKVQNIPDLCPACRVIECVPFSDKICDIG